jgi:hypothetical protein
VDSHDDSGEQAGHANICESCQPAVNSLMSKARKTFRERTNETLDVAVKTAATSTAMAMIEMGITGVVPAMSAPDASKPITADQFNDLSASYGRDAAQQAIKARAEWLVANDRSIREVVESQARIKATVDAVRGSVPTRSSSRAPRRRYGE